MRFRAVSLRCAVFATVLAAAPFASAPFASAQFPSLWPSKSGTEAEQPPAAEKAEGEETPLLESPFFKVEWPKVEMPKINWKPGFGGDANAAGTGGQNPVSRALDSVATKSREAADKVRGAWDSTVSALTPGSGPSRTADNGQPGFWSRLFRQEETPRPRTTTEFLAQDRVGTTR